MSPHRVDLGWIHRVWHRIRYRHEPDFREVYDRHEGTVYICARCTAQSN